MLQIYITLLLVLLGCICYIFIRSKKHKIPIGARLAPLEKGWPIIGILPKIEVPLCNFLTKLAEKHGALFRIRFGMRDIFVLSSYNIVKKCLKEDGDNFSGRWNGKIIEIAVKHSGIIMIDGDTWAKQRSFMLKILRDFGLGKSRTTEIVQEECRCMLNELETLEQTTVDFSELMPIYTVNIISKFIMNKRFERNDENFKYIAKAVDDMTKKSDKMQTFHFLFPFWDNSTILTKISLLLSARMDMIEHIYAIFRDEIKNHSKAIDLNSDGEDLMDRFLLEQARLEPTGSVGTFTEFQLIRSSFELFIAGYETTSTTLGWSLLFLSKYQDVQRQMHEEIVALIGSEQLPSMNDKKSLPLSQAVMDEILRLSTVAPLSVVHRNFKNAVIDGMFIPANSMIFPNLYACHRDPHVWEKPFEFYPEHFLIKNDDGGLKYNPRDELIPFSIGKRQCLGESLARTEYFIFLISIIQRFKVKFANDISEAEYQKALIGVDGVIRFSQIKDYVFEKYE